MKYDISFTILARELKAAAFFASTDKARYILNSICVEVWPDGRVLLIGTNGHALAFVKATLQDDIDGFPDLCDGQCLSVLIPSKMVHGICSHYGDELLVRLVCDGVTVPEVSLRVRRGNITKTAKAVDGEYPNVRTVVSQPKELGSRAMYIAPKLLAKFAKAIEILSGENYGMVISPSGTEADCLAITSGEAACFYGLLLPLRDRSGDINLSICPPRPAWV